MNFLIIFRDTLVIDSFDYSWPTIEEILMSIMQKLLSQKRLLNEAEWNESITALHYIHYKRLMASLNKFFFAMLCFKASALFYTFSRESRKHFRDLKSLQSYFRLWTLKTQIVYKMILFSSVVIFSNDWIWIWIG